MNNPYPTFILVMRHGEKPGDGSDPNLAPAGVLRAQRLDTYIPQTFGKPDTIIAAADSPESSRPRETVEPLAAACGLVVQTPFADKQFAELAIALRTQAGYRDKQIVVCWHHGEIPKLMKALGCKEGDYPDPWDPIVFNLILKATFAADGKANVAQISEPF
ncbi:MAG TPA: histidine phosphatase family protein [Paraburkholderia sp.]|jgi:broad specificity phosphatase PhoE|nr:histidine phosphatase family protein [Paraburkholderia sp.]